MGKLKHLKNALDNVKTRRAYHGTPHDFDTFDVKKIGTGEGAQAYGHGLYFSNSEDIAKHYRDALTDITLKDGTPLRGKEKYAYQRLLNHGEGVDEAIAEAARIVDSPVSSQMARSSAEDALPFLKKWKESGVPDVDKGRLYTVEIPDESLMLDWDLPLSEQPQIVERLKVLHPDIDEQFARYQELLDEIGEISKPGGLHDQGKVLMDGPEWVSLQNEARDIRNNLGFTPNMHGDDFYKRLTQDKHTVNIERPDRVSGLAEAQAQASEELRELGIPGITYKGATSGERNFVVFDDAMTQIVEKDGKKFLDMSPEARMQRAADMGFDEKVWYHGSAEPDIKAFDPKFTGTVQRSDWGEGVYLSPSKSSGRYYAKEAASRTKDPVGDALYADYEDVIKKHGGRGPMYEYLDFGSKKDPVNQAKYDEIKESYGKYEAHKAAFGEQNAGRVYELHTNVKNPMYYQYEGITDPWLAETAKAQGHDAVYIGHYDEGGEFVIEEALVFDPSNIRAVDAAFDPDKADSSDILAGMAPLGLAAQDFVSRRQESNAMWEGLQAGGAIASGIAGGIVSDLSRLGGYLNPMYDVETSERAADELGQRMQYVPENNQYLNKVAEWMGYLDPYVERAEKAWPHSIPGQVYESLPPRVRGLVKSAADWML